MDIVTVDLTPHIQHPRTAMLPMSLNFIVQRTMTAIEDVRMLVSTSDNRQHAYLYADET